MNTKMLCASHLALWSVLALSAPAGAQQTLLSDNILVDDFQEFRGEGLAPGGDDGRGGVDSPDAVE